MDKLPRLNKKIVNYTSLDDIEKERGIKIDRNTHWKIQT